jgi:hypothetical protein
VNVSLDAYLGDGSNARQTEMHSLDLIDRCLDALEDAARKGREEIECGDWARHEVPDATFTALVPEALEDAVIEAMVMSGRWWRGGDGFNRRRRR